MLPKTKFIFITGGVVSGLGKGITAASVGLLLKSAGYKVDVMKFDPYLNVDPGTMSPFIHGEVFVLDDGSETDLDLGHYERFLDLDLSERASVTSGKVYSSILESERRGDYLGNNVQLIPHVTNKIQALFARDAEGLDFRIIEIGGSTGDYEGDIYLESLRQFKNQFGDQVHHIHLGYLVYLQTSKEYKTKPFQVSLRELSRAGIKPDFLVARYHKYGMELEKSVLDKLALFGNLPIQRVLAIPDLDSIYKVPRFLEKSVMVDYLASLTGKEKFRPNLNHFFESYNPQEITEVVEVGLVTKYTKLEDSYLSVAESLRLAGAEYNSWVKVVFIDAEGIENQNPETLADLKKVQGIIVPGGFGKRGMLGKIQAIQYARENKIPFLGICLGLQMAVLEVLRNKCQTLAFSREMLSEDQTDNSDSDLELAIDYIPSQFKQEQKGGTMRLGGYNCWLQKGSLAYELFGQDEVRERHRHRLEVQNQYLDKLASAGLLVSGKHYHNEQDKGDFLVEMVELQRDLHPYFIATQSHPEFLSRPGRPHPLFLGLIQAIKSLK